MDKLKINKTDSTYFFREINNSEELLKVLKLRYQIMNQTRLNWLITNNRFEIEFDIFDLRSRHFGLFQIQNGKEILIGCQRSIFPPGYYDNPFAKTLLKTFPEYTVFTDISTKSTFPCQTYKENSKTIDSFYNSIYQKGDTICESSRFMIHPSFSNIRLAKFMIMSIIASLMFVYNIDNGIAYFARSHEKVYQIFGFQVLQGTTRFTPLGASFKSIFMHIKKDYIQKSIKTKIEKLANEFSLNNQIIFEAPINTQKRYSFENLQESQVTVRV